MAAGIIAALLPVVQQPELTHTCAGDFRGRGRRASGHKGPADASRAQVIIAGAGGAAHLPGMVAALTPLPVVGVPVVPAGAQLGGVDALLSIVQARQSKPLRLHERAQCLLAPQVVIA